MTTATHKKSTKLLPSNAYTKLEPGQEYQPVVPANDPRAEVTVWSVTMGLIMVAIFSAACLYIALRTGQGIEAAIPIAIMAIFFGRKGIKRSGKSTILENVIVQSIGQAAGFIAASAAFIIPAFYFNGLHVQWWHTFLACAVGGCLGVVLIIPLRKYFVKDLHGELPFPEATAINEILVSGESTSVSSGKVLLMAFGLGAVYDFLVEAVCAWNPMATTHTLLGTLGKKMADFRLDVSMNGTAAMFGLGYIIGLRYAAAIAAGSVLGCLVLIPLIYQFGSHVPDFFYAGHHYVIKDLEPDKIFQEFVKPISIGAIVVSAIFGIIRMGKIVAGSIALGFKGLKGGGHAAKELRTQTDLAPRTVVLVQVGATVLMGLLFYFVARACIDPATGRVLSVGDSAWYALIGAVVGFILSFLFTPVGAQGIAIIASNPVSGMTLISVVLTIVALVAAGLKGEGGMFLALVVGCAVCTALCVAGGFITDFKIGYWIGATPRNQEIWKFVGVIAAALVVALVIPLMDNAYHFMVQDPATGQMISNTKVLPAPQANMIAAVTKGLLENPANQPWLLYGLGGFVALMLWMAQVPMLAFALGIYLPIEVNTAVLAGALVAHLASKTGRTEKIRKARQELGILIASGLMAGGAVFGGVIPAILRQPAILSPIRFISFGEKVSLEKTPAGGWFLQSTPQDWFDGAPGQAIGLAMFILLAVACFLLARKGAQWVLHEEAEHADSD